MPFSDHADYMTIVQQMYGALYDLNVEPDFVAAGNANLPRYKVLLVPPYTVRLTGSCNSFVIS